MPNLEYQGEEKLFPIQVKVKQQLFVLFCSVFVFPWIVTQVVVILFSLFSSSYSPLIFILQLKMWNCLLRLPYDFMSYSASWGSIYSVFWLTFVPFQWSSNNLYLQLFIILKLCFPWWLQNESVLSHQAILGVVSGVSAVNVKKILIFVEAFRWWSFSWIYKNITVNCVRSNVVILFLRGEEDCALHYQWRSRPTFKAQHCHCITIFFHKVSWIP